MKARARFLVVFTLLVGFGIAFHVPQIQAKDVYNFYLISHGGPGDPFWSIVIKGMKDMEKQLGGKVKATYLGPQKHSIEILLDFLDTALASNPDGIGITISSVEPLEKPLRRIIKEKKIPVISFNTGDPRSLDERIPVLTHIGQQEFDSGVGAAKRMLEGFTPKRLLIATHKPGTVFSRERIGGIMSVVQKHKTKIPAEAIDVTLDPAKGVEILKAYLIRHPDTDALIGVGTMPTHYGIDFIKEKNLKGKIKLGGYDVDQKIVDAIKDDICLYTIDQQPYLQGYLTLEWLYLVAKYGFRPPPDLPTGPLVIDKSSLEVVRKGMEEGVYRKQ